MKLQRVPTTNLESPFSIDQFRVFFRNLSNYKTEFQNVANAVKIPVELLYGKAAIESSGLQFIKKGAKSMSERTAFLSNGVVETDNYVGLMQVGKLPVLQALLYLSDEGAYASGRKFQAPEAMVQNVMPIIKKYLPKYSPSSKGSAKANVNAAFEAAKTYPEFNILMGALVYWMLLSDPKFAQDGEIKLDKVVAAYNTGEGYSAYKKQFADTSALIAELPKFLSTGKVPETKGHILKLVGKNGAYDLLFNKKLSV